MRLALTSAKRWGRGAGGVGLLARDGKMEEMSPMALAGRGGVFVAAIGEAGFGGGKMEVLGLVGRVPIVRFRERERCLGEGTTTVRSGMRSILVNGYWYIIRPSCWLLKESISISPAVLLRVSALSAH